MDQLLADYMVFKTTIKNQLDKLMVMFELNTDEEILDWSVDLQDKDCVLRVASNSKTPTQIQYIIKQLGYDCDEL
ncbi:MAG: hypothetical protein U0V72_14930 [Cytophagales bacterium]